MDKYEDHYRQIGIRPGDSWQKLRSTYKSQMRRWHPDRFGQNEAERRQAEEKTKEINRLYKELTQFYQQNGKLPLDAAPLEAASTHAEANPYPTSATPDSKPTPWTSVSPARESQGIGLHPGLILFLVGIVIASYLLWGTEVNTTTSPSVPAPVADLNVAVTGLGNNEHAGPGSSTAQYFGINSTLGEVYSIQGIPSLIENDVWHYGTARVYFHKGRVIRWVDNEERRLKVQMTSPQSTQMPIATFGRGSTQEEVRTLQGSPLRESGNVWDYGLSRVYFDANGRVTSWQESPLSPLRIKR